ncbi:acetyltransferase GNAT family protein [Geobacter sp. OR-1]|uniref:GNAT family N-acetyltransferase n=1 Tax=Geobacter sp. OR-1 TaxID=1266765 RepID=UPI0005438B32|nr:GNAT family N-acetyltransferase [Geobacter sp. OR-1]GAM10761.1 acetyltransferase GNAT family protein [Geobacter sp. OR-1]
MVLDSFRMFDIGPFLDLAAEEGWICDPWEFEFLIRTYPQGCLVVRETGGSAVGFATGVAYCKSGWIGNLIVRKKFRRLGIGALLMNSCLDILCTSGVRTIWLTASAAGAPLYEKLGFRIIDRVARWQLNGSLDAGMGYTPSELEIHELLCSDRLGWGDDRSLICREKARLGKLIRNDRSALVIHNTGSRTNIGPWSGTIAGAGDLLDIVLTGLSETGTTYLDAPAGNSAAAAIFEAKGFTKGGETLLMYRGAAPDYRPDSIYALASMGSIG